MRRRMRYVVGSVTSIVAVVSGLLAGVGSASADGSVDPQLSIECGGHVFDGGLSREYCYLYASGLRTDGPDEYRPTGLVELSSPTGTFQDEDGNPIDTCELQYIPPAPFGPQGDLCFFTYVPTGTGSATRKDTLTGVYEGDDVFSPDATSGVTRVLARVAPKFTTTCQAVVETNTTPCTVITEQVVTVDDQGATSYYYPDQGQTSLAFSSPKGTFTPTSCKPQFLGSTKSGCSVTYAPIGNGARTDSIKVVYSGNDAFKPATFTASVSVKARVTPGITVTCPASISAGSSGTCSVRSISVITPSSGDQVRPTGVVTFSATKGTFGSRGCSLRSLYPAPGVGCSFAYRPNIVGTAARTDSIVVKYQGDHAFRPVSVTKSVKVSAPIPRP